MTFLPILSFPFVKKGYKYWKRKKITSSSGANDDNHCSFSSLPLQLELHRPIPQNSVESDHGRTSRIYFDNAGDNVTLTL